MQPTRCACSHPGFLLPNFDREYATEEELSFEGTFHGVAGTYECTTPPCTVSTANDGMISSTGGTWTFTPDADLAGEIVIDLPDTDYLYFGWWLQELTEAEGSYAFRTFSGGTVPFAVGNKFTFGHADGLLGTASYRGRAAGQYVTKDFSGGVLSGGTAGVFTAAASLTAHFGGDDIAVNDQFNIRGSVTEFGGRGEEQGTRGVECHAEQGRSCTGQRILRRSSWQHHHRDAWRRPPAQGPGRGFLRQRQGRPQAPVPLPVCSTPILPAAHIAGGFGASNTAADE